MTSRRRNRGHVRRYQVAKSTKLPSRLLVADLVTDVEPTPVFHRPVELLRFGISFTEKPLNALLSFIIDLFSKLNVSLRRRSTVVHPGSQAHSLFAIVRIRL